MSDVFIFPPNKPKTKAKPKKVGREKKRYWWWKKKVVFLRFYASHMYFLCSFDWPINSCSTLFIKDEIRREIWYSTPLPSPSPFFSIRCDQRFEKALRENFGRVKRGKGSERKRAVKEGMCWFWLGLGLGLAIAFIIIKTSSEFTPMY